MFKQFVRSSENVFIWDLHAQFSARLAAFPHTLTIPPVPGFERKCYKSPKPSFCVGQPQWLCKVILKAQTLYVKQRLAKAVYTTDSFNILL